MVNMVQCPQRQSRWASKTPVGGCRGVHASESCHCCNPVKDWYMEDLQEEQRVDPVVGYRGSWLEEQRLLC